MILQVFLRIAISIPVTLLILRIFFKDSILFKVGFIFAILIMVLTGLTRISSVYYIHPVLIISIYMILGTTALYIVKKIIKNPLEEIISKIERFSKGDLNVPISEQTSRNEVSRLNNALFSLSYNLRDIVTEIHKNSANLTNASNQINNTAQQLSEVANEQASK